MLVATSSLILQERRNIECCALLLYLNVSTAIAFIWICAVHHLHFMEMETAVLPFVIKVDELPSLQQPLMHH
jgi:hypothetical protein